MHSSESSESAPAHLNAYTSADVLNILKEKQWLVSEPTTEQSAWCERAAALLGSQAADRTALTDLLELIFHYNAHEILANVESHAVISRRAARKVLRNLALALLEPGPLTSDRFSEIITRLKEDMEMRGRDLFHPIRLALAGRAGEGELDRVILLLDVAATLHFAVPVKSAHARILEFCAALD
jgi:nondiscriminating glutamyl-tRNA synthetase